MADDAARAPRPWQETLRERLREAPRALDVVKRGNRVFIGSGCGEPRHLVRALEEHAQRLADLEILQILSLGKHRFTEPAYHDKCRFKSFFVASAVREAVAQGRADYTPVLLSDIPRLFRGGAMPLDVALIQCSPPDDHGFVSLGIAVDIVQAATESARHVIAQVNPRMPRTLGDSFIHVSALDTIVEFEEPLLEVPPPLMNDTARAIGRHVAELVEDGSTIRAGVGSIPTAVLYALEGKKDLGVHADMLTGAYLHLIRAGAVTNAKKTLHPGKIIASFCLGTSELYDFVHDNPMVAFHSVEYVNNYEVIAQNDRMVTINSGLEVDLTGQVCDDSVGYEIYSGVGGSVDFLRGARKSRGGKAVVVLPATTLDGRKSRIVPTLSEGAGVVTTRGGVQYVATEFGVVNLHGKSIRERAVALLGIAHPDFQEDLMRAAMELNYLPRGIARAAPVPGAGYPAELEVRQLFSDETEAFFRPVRAEDETALHAFFAALPRGEGVVRFLSAVPHHHARRLARIDYRREMILLGIETGGGAIVAVGRYHLDEETMTAEMDLAVLPGYEGRGIATFLLHHMAETARARGVRVLKGVVSGEDRRALGLFQHLGYVMEGSASEGQTEVRVYLNRPTEMCLTD